MDWTNERYVRLYVRDTKTWCLLGWEGQSVLALLMRKMDRAGVLDDVRTAEDIVVVLQNGMPIEVARTGLARLIERDVLEATEAGLVAPNFMEAQEAVQSDAHRAREYRARRRDAVRSDSSQNVTESTTSVTKRDEGVTRRHAPSQSVTLAVPSLAVPSRTKDPPCSPPKGEQRKPAKRKHRLPEDWEPKAGHQAKASELGLGLRLEVEKFRDHHMAKGTLMVDWDRAFFTWLRNAVEFNRGHAPQRRSHTETLIERANRLDREYAQAEADTCLDTEWSCLK
jgi:hypothetical protein